METSGHPKTELDGIRIRPRQGGREAAVESYFPQWSLKKKSIYICKVKVTLKKKRKSTFTKTE